MLMRRLVDSLFKIVSQEVGWVGELAINPLLQVMDTPARLVFAAILADPRGF